MKLVVWGVSLGMLLIAGLFVGAQLLLPGDTAMLLVTSDPNQAELMVRVRQPQPGGLQTGDTVLALDGRSVDDWLRAAWHNPLGGPSDPGAARMTYTVRRADQVIEVSQPLAPLSLGQALSGTWTYVVFILTWLAVAAGLMVRRPDLAASRALLLLGSAIAGTILPFYMGLRASDLRYGWLVALFLVAAVLLNGLMVAGALHFTLVFPTMRPEVRRRTWLVPLLYLTVWVPYLGVFLMGWDPTAAPAAVLLRLVSSSASLAAVYFTLVVLNAIRTYRVTADARLRRQLRWIVWGFVVAALPWLLLTTLPEVLGFRSLLPAGATGLLWCVVPATIAIAVLREGLFDIDILINRTLVYGGLTVLLGLAYFGGVIILQSLLDFVIGQRQPELVTVLSTLMIAALAAPLRARLQTAIDRRFYRRKYDAGRTLAAFGAAMRDEVELEVLEAKLIAAVDETMQPAHASLWRRDAPG